MDMVTGQAGKFQYGRAHVGVIGPGVATDSNTIDLSYSPHHARAARRRRHHTPKDRSLPTNNPKNWSVWYSLGTETQPYSSCFTIEARGKHATLLQGYSAGMPVHGCECFR
jgi:hypothetical protein